MCREQCNQSIHSHQQEQSAMVLQVHFAQDLLQRTSSCSTILPAFPPHLSCHAATMPTWLAPRCGTMSSWCQHTLRTHVIHFLVSPGGTIELADGQQLQYDWLVLALGSSTSFFGIPGVKEFALPFNDFNDAMQVCIQATCKVVGRGSNCMIACCLVGG